MRAVIEATADRLLSLFLAKQTAAACPCGDAYCGLVRPGCICYHGQGDLIYTTCQCQMIGFNCCGC
jgi:hypothetical protein